MKSEQNTPTPKYKLASVNINNSDVALIYNALTFLETYGEVYRKQYDYQTINSLHNSLNKSLTHNLPLYLNRKNSHIMDKAVTCMSEHFDLFKLACQSQHIPKHAIQNYKKSLPHTLKLINRIAVDMIMNESPITVKQHLEKDKRFIQHDFVPEALNNMFKGFQVNHHNATDHPTNMTSSIALDAINDMDEKHDYDIYNLDDIITGTKHCLHHDNLTGDEFDEQMAFLHRLENLYNNGRHFVIVNDSGEYKVNQSQALELVNTALNILNNITN